MTENTDQLDLDFRAPAKDGYAAREWDRQQALRLAQIPVSLDRRRPLFLKMERHVFESSGIEVCAVSDV